MTRFYTGLVSYFVWMVLMPFAVSGQTVDSSDALLSELAELKTTATEFATDLSARLDTLQSDLDAIKVAIDTNAAATRSLLEREFWPAESRALLGMYQSMLQRVPTREEMEQHREDFLAGTYRRVAVQGSLVGRSDYNPFPQPSSPLIDDDGTVVIPDPDPEPAPLLATFLKHEAAYSTHFFLAHSVSDESREAELAWHQAMGYNTIHWYLWLDGDYNGVHRYNFTADEVERVLYWIDRAEAHDLIVVLWFMSDDGFRWFNRNDPEQVRQRWQLAIDKVVRPAGIRYVVMALEALEYWTPEVARSHGQWLRDALPANTKLIWHTLGGDRRLIGEPWMDMVAWQSGFEFSPEQVAQQIRELRNDFPSLPIIAAEYHMSGETDEARAIGTAAIRAGAAGAWNGAFPIKEVNP
ncbi:MAG: hypothetical protein ABQ298_03765 [Puniceicoccaceae bacterium]